MIPGTSVMVCGRSQTWTLSGEQRPSAALSSVWNCSISSREHGCGSGRKREAARDAFAMASLVDAMVCLSACNHRHLPMGSWQVRRCFQVPQERPPRTKNKRLRSGINWGSCRFLELSTTSATARVSYLTLRQLSAELAWSVR